jgi:REP element-mobilizing transposase RayT
MVHASIRATPGTLLFVTVDEARALWDRVTAAVRFVALALMPDHLHAQLVELADMARLAVALRGYALWRNSARGQSGPVWDHRSRPTPIAGRRHVERTIRYIHLNPCRERLVADPLAWPFSTHRDAVGLALPPVRPPARDPERFHAWVSGDPDVAPNGTPLPDGARGLAERASLSDVLAAVSALTRSSEDRVRGRSPERRLFVTSARELARASTSEIADFLGVHAATVRRVPAGPDPRIGMVARVLGDRRFPPLRSGDLREDPAWRAYSHLR